MKVVFMGTPEFSVPVLQALVDHGHDVICVYTQPPRPAGRGKKDRPSPVHKRAIELGIEVRHPENFKSENDRAAFAALSPEVAVVVAYGLILPQAVLDIPQKGCLNIHASLLPRWRGAAPIQRAIMAGDTETGVCVMQMEAGLDTGPVLLRKATPIGPEETTGELHDRLSALGAEAIIAALKGLDGLTPIAQSDEGVTYAEKIDKSEAAIDWSLAAEDVDRKIRGLSPMPGAWVYWQGSRLKLLASRVEQGVGSPGTVLDHGLLVACGSNAVRLMRLQKAGKKPQSLEEFQRGVMIPIGAQLHGG